MAAGLAGSSLKELILSECLNCCSERCHHPAVTNVTNYVADVAPYPLSKLSLLSTLSVYNSISDSGQDGLKSAWSAAGKDVSRLDL